jgi:inward rectifier potassium channel
MSDPRPYDPQLAPATSFRPVVVGDSWHPLRDLYHLLLRLSWPQTLALLVAGFFGINGAFALLYLWSGGVTNARAGDLLDAFSFSVQTFATIGYGAMAPQSAAAHAIVIVESMVALVSMAITTGLLFARFSAPTSRVMFSQAVTISTIDGVPHLQVRVGNARGDNVLSAHVRIVLTRTRRLPEGYTLYLMEDLALARERAPALSRSFLIRHPITEASPLYGLSKEDMAAQEVELTVTVEGVDEVTHQHIHALHHYEDRHILPHHRPADLLHEREDGAWIMDLRLFHYVVRVDD